MAPKPGRWFIKFTIASSNVTELILLIMSINLQRKFIKLKLTKYITSNKLIFTRQQMLLVVSLAAHN